MSDERLRQLEREAASGDVEARTRLLLERLRAGELTEERLKFAAHLGDEAAQQATGRQETLVSSHLAHPKRRRWFEGLARFGDGVPERVAWAVVRAAIREEASKDCVAAAITAAEHYFACPCPDHLSMAVAKAEELHRYKLGELPSKPVEALRLFLAAVTKAPSAWIPPRAAKKTGLSAADIRWPVILQTAFDAAAYTVPVSQEESLIEVIRKDLLPWALGERDPVIDGVEARGQQ